MKEVLVMRHAKSSWKDNGISDHQRTLNARGNRDAPRMAAWIRSAGLCPDIVLSSSAVRAHKTAEAVLGACPNARLDTLDALYLAGPADYIEHLRELPQTVARAMVVGHNPGLEQFVSILGGDIDAMPTAALAHLELPIDSWDVLNHDMQGRLLNFWIPKALPDPPRDARS